MAKKRFTQTESPEQKIAGAFAEMLINKIEKLHVDWKQPWVAVDSVSPRNMDGKRYSGMNALMLMLLSEQEGYKMPYFMTYNKAVELGAEVKKGEKSFPVCYWNINVKDKDGNAIPYEDYKAMNQDEREQCKVFPFLKVYRVFNIQQTRYPELYPDKYAALADKVARPVLKDADDKFRCVELDHMLKNNTWMCPVDIRYGNDAFYSISKDAICIPEKSQFALGEEFYGTLLHEMAHSTGAESRLNRHFGGSFGSAEYAREELVAEMTSAIVCNEVGISKGVKDQSVAYLQSWLRNLKEDPKFILSLMGDINKAAAMIQEHVFTPEMEQTVKEEAMQDISNYLDTKAAEEKEKAHQAKVFTPQELKQQTVSINRHRFGDFVPVQTAPVTDKQADTHEAYQPYMQAKDKYPDEVVLVMDKNDYYTFDKDAQRIAQILDKDLQGGDMLRLGADDFDKIVPVLVRETKMRITSMANVTNNMKAQAEQTDPPPKNCTWAIWATV